VDDVVAEEKIVLVLVLTVLLPLLDGAVPRIACGAGPNVVRTPMLAPGLVKKAASWAALASTAADACTCREASGGTTGRKVVVVPYSCCRYNIEASDVEEVEVVV
jgi:hypothetical protein